MVKKPAWRNEKYSAWLDQLLAKVEEPASSDPQATQLFQLLVQKRGDPKKRFQSFLKGFRALLLQRKDYGEWLESVLEGFFFQPFHEFSKNTVQEIHGVSRPVPVCVEDLNIHLLEIWSTIHMAGADQTISPVSREWRRFRARWSLAFDPFYEGNLPMHLYSLKCSIGGKEKDVPLLRIGCPTVEICSYLPARVNPEFTAFLRMYERQEKRHLYINFQNRDPRWLSRWTGFNSEKARCRAVEGLGDDFINTLYEVTLSKDSPFYQQSGVFADVDTWSVFSELFLKELFEGPYNYIPYDLPLDEIKGMMDEIHQKLFDGHSHLSLRERCDFIEIFYLRFIEYLIVYFDVDSYNASCTDCIDRGTISNVLMYFFQRMRNESVSIRDIAETLATMVFSPALLVRQRAIRKHRLERILSVIEHLSTKQPSWQPFAKGGVECIT